MAKLDHIEKEKTVLREQGYHCALRYGSIDEANVYRLDWKRAAFLQGYYQGKNELNRPLPKGQTQDKDGIRKLSDIIKSAVSFETTVTPTVEPEKITPPPEVLAAHKDRIAAARSAIYRGKIQEAS